ncbi:hypothetical protein D770_02425 [Flammeovirgaceae bacterium 311]|nr:hypothetical protein D770_02425 [Flammeovirgaceae bacterium 311]
MKHQVGVSYYGASITRPGFGLINEFSHDLDKGHSLSLRTTLGFSHHRRLSNTYFILLEGVYRYKFNSGFFLNALAGGGYQYARLIGDVYEYDNGAFEKAKNPSRGYFMPSAGLGFGKKWSADKESPFTWFLNARANAKYPFNNLWLWFPSVETGLMYEF